MKTLDVSKRFTLIFDGTTHFVIPTFDLSDGDEIIKQSNDLQLLEEISDKLNEEI